MSKKRSRMSRRRSKKLFSKTALRTKSVNTRPPMRGGFRL
jgi:hypothetical protein|nr:MAG TPA: hypothetical protein [Microviridae sp.]